MRVLVTGAGGFVGRHVVLALAARGDDVVALDSIAADFPQGVIAVTGDIGERKIRAQSLAGGVDAVVHLATVAGGAAETDPDMAKRINVDATYDLLREAAGIRARPRFVFASSIAVFGEPLPSLVNDDTPLAPKMIYGGHKAMMELAVAMFSRRGAIDGVSLRLPAILARPRAPSGMKSAFISDMFHALKAGEPFTCPVSAEGTIWAQSVACSTRNLLHALTLDTALMPQSRAVTLPALRVSMGDLAAEITRQCNASAALVRHLPDAALEAAFAAQPPLATPAANRAGFTDDRDVAALTSSALATLQ
jgi:nucleoside-diphosphate-sugar epimerase